METKLCDDELMRILQRVNRLIATGEVQLIYLNRHEAVPDSAYLSEIAQSKRFLERWAADANFRARLEQSPDEAAGALGLSVPSQDLKYLWHAPTACATSAEDIPLPSLRYRSFILEKITHRNQMRQNLPSMDPRFAAWRTRQMKRAEHELSTLAASAIIHAPFAIELCDGCSVGCWFCGISAPKLDGLYLHTPENAALFQGVIGALQEFFGEAANRGFLYWATDPLDNPDFEKFMVDLHGLTGHFVQTTTALALKDIARTRALLELSRSKRGMLDRFSLLSLGQLDRVHREFTPEELLYVELVTQNRENHQAKAKAGRAINGRANGKPTTTTTAGDAAVEGTIACVSGFLINMVRRSVRLISPCVANERWPLGYIEFDEGTFTSVASFRDLIQRMADRHMAMSLYGDEPLAFQHFLSAEELPDGLRLTGRHATAEFRDNPTFAAISRALRESRATTSTVVDQVSLGQMVDPAEVLYGLNLLFSHGMLDTLPHRVAADNRLYEVQTL